MLKRKALTPLQNEPKQFLNLVFIVPKKSEGFCPVINLSKLNSCDEQNHLFLNKVLELSVQTGNEGCFINS